MHVFQRDHFANDLSTRDYLLISLRASRISGIHFSDRGTLSTHLSTVACVSQIRTSAPRAAPAVSLRPPAAVSLASSPVFNEPAPTRSADPFATNTWT